MWGSMFSLVVGRVSYQEVIHDLGPRTQRLLLTLHTVSAPIYVFHCCSLYLNRFMSTKDLKYLQTLSFSLSFPSSCPCSLLSHLAS